MDDANSIIAHAAQSTIAHDASPAGKLSKEFLGKNCSNGYKPRFC